jgi:hypothetical protein
MRPFPADSTFTPNYFTDREALAAHKFNQKRIMGMSARRGLVVQYFRHQWAFIEPFDMNVYVHSLSDVNAIKWLSAVQYPRKPGTLDVE